MERQDLGERLLGYGAQVVVLVEALPRTLACRRIGDQSLRSAISVGANYEEAQAAESKDDFVHKLQGALKELRKSHYWLRLLIKAKTSPSDRVAAILDESTQFRSSLSKAVATTIGKGKPG